MLKEKEVVLSPIVKWAGGKEQELKYIIPNIPCNFSRFVEPFVGGGAVWFSITCEQKSINDKSIELINLYNSVKFDNDVFVSKLQSLFNTWTSLEKFLNLNLVFFFDLYSEYKLDKITREKLQDKILSFLKNKRIEIENLLDCDLKTEYLIFEKELLRNIKSKFVRMKDLEIKKGKLPKQDLIDNFECALKGSFYMFIRILYNESKHKNIHYFYFIREYCYSSMFRYNADGKFNVPYGGISYNRKNFQRKIDYIKSEILRKHFSNTQIYNLDFEDFLESIKLAEDDFVFVDPPYDTDFSNYANNSFDEVDQRRLASYLIEKCPAKFMLVIKNTQLIRSLYVEGTPCRNGNVIRLNSFEKKYLVSFKNRNDKNVEHLLITNY